MILQVGNKPIQLWDEPTGGAGKPLVLLPAGEEEGIKVWEETGKRTTAPFSLAALPIKNGKLCI